MTIGTSIDNSCSGNIPPIKRLGFPGLCVSDAGNGLRNAEFVSSWPNGIHVAARYDSLIIIQVEASIANESLSVL